MLQFGLFEYKYAKKFGIGKIGANVWLLPIELLKRGYSNIYKGRRYNFRSMKQNLKLYIKNIAQI